MSLRAASAAALKAARRSASAAALLFGSGHGGGLDRGRSRSRLLAGDTQAQGQDDRKGNKVSNEVHARLLHSD